MKRNDDYYYSDNYGSSGGRRGRSLAGIVFDFLAAVATVAFALALIVAYLTPYFNPSTLGSLTIVGMFAPVLYLAVIAALLYWTIRRRWIVAAALLVVLIAGAFDVSKFYRIEFKRRYQTEAGNRDLKMLTYNVHGFHNAHNKADAAPFAAMLAELPAMPDILCFQEFNRTADDIERIDSLLGGYSMIETVEFSDIVLRTYSRYPIISSGRISGQSRGTSQWCDILLRDDTLRIFNNHLHSMHLTADDSDDIAKGKIFFDDDKMRSIVQRIQDNSSIRASHVDTLTQVIRSTRCTKIVCGDFNDTPMSYVYRQMCRDMKDAFVEAGRGYGYTFLPMHRLLRIDYVMCSHDIDIKDYRIMDECTLSDHLPVAVRMKRIK